MKLNKQDLEIELIYSFAELYRLFEVIIKYKTSESLSMKETFILENIKRLSLTNDSLTTNLAKALYITPSSTSIAIKALEKKGFVFKDEGKSDRRLSVLKLSEKASLYLDKQHEFRIRAINEISSNLLEGEKISFINALAKIRKFARADMERIKKDPTPIIK